MNTVSSLGAGGKSGIKCLGPHRPSLVISCVFASKSGAAIYCVFVRLVSKDRMLKRK